MVRMRLSLIKAVVTVVLLAGYAGCSAIKPAEILDERSGMTVGALQEPIELVENMPNAALAGGKRTSFAYLGPVEWDASGEITYALWIHVAPGNDTPVGDIRTRDAVTLDLDDGPVQLTAMDTPKIGVGPYRAVASWGQTAYYPVTVDLLKRMAASQKLNLGFHTADRPRVDFLPSHETRSTLTQFLHARGITVD
jgi:hypothetical protein